MIRITHYIDRQFGHPVHLGTENNIIKFVAKAELNNDTFNTKFSNELTNKSIEDAKKWLKSTFKGVRMAIHEFNTPLQNKIENN